MPARIDIPDAALLDRFVITASIALPPEHPPDRPRTAHAHAKIELWRSADHALLAIIDISTTTFSGDAETIDAVSTDGIVSLLSTTAMERAMRRGRSGRNERVRIWLPESIRRAGAGLATVLTGDGEFVPRK